MYSGSDSTESQKYPQWALNPSNYQNMSNDQVDWAALAQQWIIMKEAGPPPLITDSKNKAPKDKEPLNEGGEAPMEVEDKEEGAATGGPPNNDSWSWNAQSQTWAWNNAWTPPTGVPPPPIPMKPPLLPTPPSTYNKYNAPPDSTSDNATFAGYNSAPNNDYTTGYWTSAGGSKQIKPHNRRFSKVNVPRPVQPTVQVESQPPPALDAAKRKQLPAWIREGLEKMEKDKQKQIEKEKEKLEREEYNEKLKQSEKETMEILKTTIKEQQRSKFESDGEYSEEEEEEEVPEKKKVPPEPVPLTPEEQMLNVRRTMTEILLKVTSREIETICREELQRHYKRLKASDQRVSAPSGANVTAKLGLGMYGGDSDSSSDSETEDVQINQKDSDSELRDSIKRKKADFQRTEREIEDRLNEAESNKRQGSTASRTPSPDRNGNDTQVDAKSQGRKPRPGDVPFHSGKTGAAPLHSSKIKPRSSSSSSSEGGDSRRRRSSTSSSSSDGDGGGSGGADPAPAVSSITRSKIRRHRSRSSSRSSDDRERHRRVSDSTRSYSSKSRRSRSDSRHRKGRHRSRRSRSRSRRRSRSTSYRRRRSRSRGRRSRSKSSYSRSRRSRSRSSRSSRKRRSRSSSSGGGGGGGRGKRSRKR